jgi:hypothetical protein
MYISLMAMQKDNFINTMDTQKSYRRDFAFALKRGKRLDTLHTAQKLRQDIIKAAKISVGLDVMNFAVKPSEHQVAEHVWGRKSVTDEFKENKHQQYAQFARLPFNVIFIENATGGHLVRRNPDGITWTQTGLFHVFDYEKNISFAMALAQDLVVDPRRVDKDGFIWAEPIHSEPFKAVAKRGSGEIMRSQIRVYASQVAEVLLFLNVKNTQPQRYKAKKSDFKNGEIPRIYEPYVDYHVLDIYRKNPPIESLDDLAERVIGQIKRPLLTESRAHLVRGHFKTIHGSLFWWNPFMRNRHRLETHGFADKDYNLKT